ncbi:MAG: FliM/FliN family flagellar motor switch protein [Deltaproteobacteria bacterium]|nr:FliM/FliN family flagellar motor switch protein [Deltaproteobacteria bacterium]
MLAPRPEKALPFPFPWLPRWTREEASWAGLFARRAGPVTVRDALGPRWRRLLGGPLEAWAGAPVRGPRDEVLSRWRQGALAVVACGGSLGAAVALVDRAFAKTLAHRALGADQEQARALGHAPAGLQPAEEGALVVLAGRALALALGGSPAPRVRAVTEDLEHALETLGDPSTVVLAWPWRLSVGLDAGEVVLCTPAESLGAPPLVPPPEKALERLGDLTLRFSVTIARDTLGARTVASLVPGDALLCDSVRWGGTGLTGTGSVRLGAVELPVRLDAGGVTVDGALAPCRRALVVDEPVTDPSERTAVLSSLPVEVTVEIAQGAVTVGELAAWRPGAVVTLGTRLGEAVVVRAGGRLIARGELVDVEGEVGVRLTELL